MDKDDDPTCTRCWSKRLTTVGAKCSDRCHVHMGEHDHDGYVPKDMRIGGGDYLEFEFCLNCGQMQGTFPVPVSQLEGAS